MSTTESDVVLALVILVTWWFHMKGRNSQESGWTKSTGTCIMIEVPQQ